MWTTQDNPKYPMLDEIHPKDKMALVMVLAGGVGVIQVIFIVNTIQKVFPSLRHNRAIEKTIKFIQVSPIVAMVASAIWFFFLVFLPVKVKHPYSSKEGLFLVTVACYLWVNVTFNYFAAMLTSPGHPPTTQAMEEEGLTCENDCVLCLKCDRVKTTETHHCGTCGRCVTMMCHHCPFTNNCVGLENYSYFYLFICYSVVGLAFSLYMTHDAFYHCMVYSGEHLSLLPWYPPGICRKLGDYAVIFIPVAFMALFTLAMFCLQSLLLLSDWSTIDLLTNAQRSKNCAVFGQNLLKRIMNKKKRRLRIMFLYSRKYWWQFLVPNFNVPSQHMQTVRLMV